MGVGHNYNIFVPVCLLLCSDHVLRTVLLPTHFLPFSIAAVTPCSRVESLVLS